MSNLLLISNSNEDHAPIKAYLKESSHLLFYSKFGGNEDVLIARHFIDLILLDSRHVPEQGDLPDYSNSKSLPIPLILIQDKSERDTTPGKDQSRSTTILQRPFSLSDFERAVHHALSSHDIEYERRIEDHFNQIYQTELEALVKKHLGQLRESECALDTLIELNPMGVCLSKFNGRIFKKNAAFVRMCGLEVNADEENLLLKSLFLSDSEYKRALQVLKAKGKVKDFAASITRKNGLDFQAQISIVPTFFQGSQCLMTTFENTSVVQGTHDLEIALHEVEEARHEAEEAHHEAEEAHHEAEEAHHEVERERKFLDSIIDNIPLSIVVRSAADQSIVKINKASETLIGYTRQEVIGTRGDDIFSEEELETFLEMDSEVIQNKAPLNRSNQKMSTYKNGIRRLHMRKIPIFDDHGDVEFVVAISEDVTEKLMFEDALLEASLRAESASDLRSSLLQNLGHEIRTPLSALIGFAQVLEEELDDDHSEYAHLIAEGGHHLMETIENVMQLSLIESGNVKLKWEVLNIGEFVGSLVREMQPEAVKKGLSLDFEEVGGPVMSILDRQSFKLIVSNILANAMKFTEKGFVRVSARSVGNSVEFEVRDSGVGISASFLPRIFESFQQESTGDDRSFGGNGIGLAIVKSLVELHRGEVKVVSKKRKGTSFTVSLPRLTVVGPSTSKLLGNRTKRTAKASTPRVRILTLDQSQKKRITLGHLFETLPEIQHFEWANSPAEVFLLAQKSEFNLFLIPFEDEEQGEIEALVGDLNESLSNQHTRIVALRSHFTQNEELHYSQLGFTDCLSIPLEKVLLTEFIHHHFGHFQAANTLFPTLLPREVSQA